MLLCAGGKLTIFVFPALKIGKKKTLKSLNFNLMEKYIAITKDGMTITKDGEIDAFEDTPLYTNGQKSVIAIKSNTGELIWEK